MWTGGKKGQEERRGEGCWMAKKIQKKAKI